MEWEVAMKFDFFMETFSLAYITSFYCIGIGRIIIEMCMIKFVDSKQT